MYMTRQFRRADPFHAHLIGNPAHAGIRGMDHVVIVAPHMAGYRRFLGLDPTDRSTWIRPYAPADGMISFLNDPKSAMNSLRARTGSGSGQ